jgi:hypothetical protein
MYSMVIRTGRVGSHESCGSYRIKRSWPGG